VRFTVPTKGHTDFVNITEEAKRCVRESGVQEGVAVIFVEGSTVALTTMEDEEGIKEDLQSMLEKVAPENFDYEHHKRWGDRNGAAHIRSALIGTSTVVPIEERALKLGTWQDIFLIDFDEKPRTREVHVTCISATSQ
jgi:secondary thiamine-phosphate synthase enzyme